MLNEKQLQAIEHILGPVLVIAGPGSGKTTVLTKRISYLIERGINSSKILVITFTKAAATEMKSRFNYISNGKTEITFGTFHSIYYSFIKEEGSFSDYSILGNKDKNKLLMECLGRLNITLKFQDSIEDIIKDISCHKSLGTDIKRRSLLSCRDFNSLLPLYEAAKNEHKFLDFEDILIIAKRLLENKAIREYWQNKYSFFLVDEFQDINNIQYEILNLLVKDNPEGENIFAVGDDDQSIYGFRGSSPAIMTDFLNRYKNCRLITLDKNYRSKGSIILASKNLIEKNNNRFKKDYYAENSQRGEFKIKKFKDEFIQADYILQKIKEAVDSKEDKIGILFRKNSQAEILYTGLLKGRLKYFSNFSSKALIDSFIYRDIASYIKIITGEYGREDIMRIMNKPDRGLLPGGLSRESSTLISWRNYYPKNGPAYQDIDRLICDIKLLRGLLPYTGIRYIINAMGYGKYLKEYGKKMQTDFSNHKESLDKILYISKEFNSYEKCLSSLTDCEKTDGGRKPDQEKIFLYTFHGCKGLEFDRVFILDAIEDITPSKGSLDIEEERRMFYVAMTRAKSELTVCIPMEYKKNKTYPSRFVSECSCDIIS